MRHRGCWRNYGVAVRRREGEPGVLPVGLRVCSLPCVDVLGRSQMVDVREVGSGSLTNGLVPVLVGRRPGLAEVVASSISSSGSSRIASARWSRPATSQNKATHADSGAAWERMTAMRRTDHLTDRQPHLTDRQPAPHARLAVGSAAEPRQAQAELGRRPSLRIVRGSGHQRAPIRPRVGG